MSTDYLRTRCLCHHGIKGQKWGVRRFQNEDGSLTDAGKKRYSEIIKDHVVSGLTYPIKRAKDDFDNDSVQGHLVTKIALNHAMNYGRKTTIRFADRLLSSAFSKLEYGEAIDAVHRISGMYIAASNVQAMASDYYIAKNHNFKTIK